MKFINKSNKLIIKENEVARQREKEKSILSLDGRIPLVFLDRLDFCGGDQGACLLASLAAHGPKAAFHPC